MNKRIVNEIGNKHGLLTVVSYAGSKNKMAMWNCVCDCGGSKQVAGKLMRIGNTLSCGCLKVNKLEGKRFGRLVAVEATLERRSGNVRWLCLCDCGTYTTVDSTKLVIGEIRSCGCLRRDTHWDGYYDISMTYFGSMRRRAEKDGRDFVIKIEEVWQLYLAQNKNCALSGVPISLKDKTASLDRIDSSKGYIPDNVQWVHKHINRMKMDHSEADFLTLCTQVVQYSGSKLTEGTVNIL